MVDDDAVVVQVVRRLLEPYQYRVTLAESPAAAVALVERGAPVDLVITDYDMPLMDGLDLAERLHAIRPELPILLVTGLIEEAAIRRMGDAGIVALVHKPFTGADLAGTVRRALDGVARPS
ncbi:MAG: response regulator [Gemmatimonadota bacterium]